MNIVFYICVILIVWAAVFALYPFMARIAKPIIAFFKRYYDKLKDEDHDIYI